MSDPEKPKPAKISDIDESSVDELGEPLLVEDLLLVLFDPSAGVFAGEGTLFWVLGGAVLTELALNGHVEAIEGGRGLGGTVSTVSGVSAPKDALLRAAWDELAAKPARAQAFLAAIGPSLRGPVLNRLVLRGEIVQTRGKALKFIPITKLTEGENSRRSGLVSEVRAALVDGAKPSARIGALAALWSASQTLPQFHREIPWSSQVATRSQAFERGDWGAGEAGAAVNVTNIAIIVNATIAASVVANR